MPDILLGHWRIWSKAARRSVDTQQLGLDAHPGVARDLELRPNGLDADVLYTG